jgi:hypothetical protein
MLHAWNKGRLNVVHQVGVTKKKCILSMFLTCMTAKRHVWFSDFPDITYDIFLLVNRIIL